ncbi:MAG: restriction endonuclease [Actinobacteria bacterium]|nr:restriction endonuclease [Actinomycetota bacterium]
MLRGVDQMDETRTNLAQSALAAPPTHGPGVPFDALDDCDLVVDAVYEGGHDRSITSDPLTKMLRVANQGGFRKKRTSRRDGFAFAVLYTTGDNPDWPDILEPETGLFYYYGDNRKPGRAIHETSLGGNELLRQVFDSIHADPSLRAEVPPFFIFERTGERRNVQFRGLAVPGGEGIGPSSDLVAVWRTHQGRRFQNYRATFSILDEPVVPREWLSALLDATPLHPSAPSSWIEWVMSGRYATLRAPRTIQIRSKLEQLPSRKADWSILQSIHEYFINDPFEFESCAAHLWRMQSPRVSEYRMTRRSVDGGRDAVGFYTLGPAEDPISMEFALEAKCYSPQHGVGVRELSRLISRLRHRQFGVLVTTAFLSRQAYEELRNDEHPVVVISGADIVRILRAQGIRNRKDVLMWLHREFPVEGPSHPGLV